MKRKLLVGLLISLSLLLSLFAISKIFYPGYTEDFVIQNKMLERFYEPVLGVYDRQEKISQQEAISMQHFSIILNNDRDWEIKKNLLENIPDKVSVLLTVEMWGAKYLSKLSKNPLEETTKGNFDQNIKDLCKRILKNRKNIYVRWNPEMEVPVNRYPWQKYSQSYIAAFRYFSQLCKKEAPLVKIVWGPAGYPGATENYPGDDVVDAASVTLKSESEMLSNAFPKDDSIPQLLKRKLHRLRFINKPVFILGSHNLLKDSFKTEWILSAIRTINREKEIVYSDENFIRPTQKQNQNRDQKLIIGLYDPNLLLTNEKAITVEHIFSDFGNIQSGLFEKMFNEVIARNHHVIATIEPWKDLSGKPDSDVLKHISKGKYDDIIKKLFGIISKTRHTVYLRFAHEMEIPITRYAWQSKDPIDYIKAFRHFMTVYGKLPENVKRVWGPTGDRGSLEWWPGNDAVDFISIAIYGLPDKNITDPEKQESFKTIFNRKYWRMRFVDKPVFITEFGVKGTEEYQTKWLESAALTINENKQIKGINYFNMTDLPKAWGHIKPPDWSISKKSFHSFLANLDKELL